MVNSQRIQDRAQRAGLDRGGSQRLDAASVHGFQLVQWGVDLVDLHLGDREALFHSAVGQPACEEGFTRTVFAANGFEHRSAGGDHVELGVQFGLEPPEPDRELVQPVRGHGAAPQRVEDFAASPRRHRASHSATPNCSLRAATSRRTTPPPTRSTS